jgi:hypothetical protein
MNLLSIGRELSIFPTFPVIPYLRPLHITLNYEIT